MNSWPFLHQRFDGPVLHRLERIDLALTLDEQSQRDCLHATGGDSLLYGLPENRACLVSDEAVEHSPRLLRVNLALIDLAGAGDGGLHRFLRYLVEKHALHRRAIFSSYLSGDVPCYRLALTVRIRRQQNLARILRRILQLG